MSTVTLQREKAEIDALGPALGRLWRREEQKDDPTLLSRCLTMNLIAVAAADQEQALAKTVDRLLVRHPCRAFLVLQDSRADALAASAEAKMRKQGQSRMMILEQLNLHVGARQFAKVPGLVRPLLVNDIPVHLFWGGPLPADMQQIATLAGLADSVVVDSGLFTGAADLHKLEQLAPRRVLDLAWFRLSSWRRALAEAFERFTWQPTTRTTITLTHGRSTAAACASHLLRGWLEAKLDAKVVLLPAPAGNGQPDAPALEPAQIEVHHGDVHVLVSHLCTECSLRVDVTLDDRCLMPFHIPASRGAQGDLLAAAVDA